MHDTSDALPYFKSSPLRALQSVVSTPQWPMNLMWLTLAVLLQSVFVGQIAVLGYGVDLFRVRSGRPENATPDISADRLKDYITQGIWPFLVLLVTQVALTFFVSITILATDISARV